MEGSVIADNGSMTALARKPKFTIGPVPDDTTVVHVERALGTA
jgi:hypothetical protein